MDITAEEWFEVTLDAYSNEYLEKKENEFLNYCKIRELEDDWRQWIGNPVPTPIKPTPIKKIKRYRSIDEPFEPSAD